MESQGHRTLSTRVLIFSKDRPLQLHATLKSFQLQCEEAAITPISVIYRSTKACFEEGYAKLKHELAGDLEIDWIRESRFKQDLLNQLRGDQPYSGRQRILNRLLNHKTPLRCKHLAFLVDDNLFIQPFSLNVITSALATLSTAIGFSLRLGRNTSYCYSSGCDQAIPDFIKSDGILRFNWLRGEHDFNYPLEVSSSVYRVEDLIGLLTRLNYANPNQLEQALSVSKKSFSKTNYDLLCFDHSVAFCAPVNKVQSVFANRSGSQDDYSSDALNTLFLKGGRVDVAALQGFVPKAAHQEIELPITMS
jgi:hypothetical protein